MRVTFDSLPDVLTPADLVAFLPVGRNTVYDLLSRGQISSIRCGRKLVIPKRAVEVFLDLKNEARMSHA